MTDILWGSADDETLAYSDADEVFASMVNDMLPEELDREATAYQFKRVEIPRGYFNPLERLLEDLDDEFGGEDPSEPTEAMKAAEQAFIDAVLKDYVPWRCDPTGEKVTVNLLEWAKENGEV
jgi:hypothetical protein